MEIYVKIHSGFGVVPFNLTKTMAHFETVRPQTDFLPSHYLKLVGFLNSKSESTVQKLDDF